MKKKLLITPITCLLLSSCNRVNSINEKAEEFKNELDYDSFTDRHIVWSDLFNLLDEEYYVYIYSKTCGHCNHIKSEILNIAYCRIFNLYFCEFCDDIPVKDSIISGYICSFSDIAILGTPTILYIKNICVIDNIAGSDSIIYYLTSK